jgi:hypothetical protein
LCNTRGGKSSFVRSHVFNSPAWPWADEKCAVLTKFAVSDSALSVARRSGDGSRRDRPPLAPPSKGGEALRSTRGGKSSFVRSHVFNSPAWPWADEKCAVLTKFAGSDSALSVARRSSDGGRRNDPPWPPLLKGGKLGATFATGNLRSVYGKFSTAHPHPGPLPAGEGAEAVGRRRIPQRVPRFAAR